MVLRPCEESIVPLSSKLQGRKSQGWGEQSPSKGLWESQELLCSRRCGQHRSPQASQTFAVLPTHASILNTREGLKGKVKRRETSRGPSVPAGSRVTLCSFYSAPAEPTAALSVGSSYKHLTWIPQPSFPHLSHWPHPTSHGGPIAHPSMVPDPGPPWETPWDFTSIPASSLSSQEQSVKYLNFSASEEEGGSVAVHRYQASAGAGSAQTVTWEFGVGPALIPLLCAGE